MPGGSLRSLVLHHPMNRPVCICNCHPGPSDRFSVGATGFLLRKIRSESKRLTSGGGGFLGDEPRPRPISKDAREERAVHGSWLPRSRAANGTYSSPASSAVSACISPWSASQ
jgi:hypothetical protein